MPFVPVARTMMAELRGILDGQRVENTLYFRTPADPTLADAAALADALEAWWQGVFPNWLTTQFQLREIYITSLISPTAFTYSMTPGTPNTGVNTTEAVPNSVALCVSFRTEQRGRSARGRNYVAGLDGSYLTLNTWTAGIITAVQTAYQSLIGVAADAGAEWVVVSRYTNNAPRTLGQALPVINATIVDNIADSQRRRLPGRGT